MISYRISILSKELTPIRDSYDAIKLVIAVSSHIITLPIDKLYYDSPSFVPIELYQSHRMNRLVWGDDVHQLHSIHYPFTILLDEDSLYLQYKGIAIDNTLMHGLGQIFSTHSVRESLDCLLDEFADFGNDADLSEDRLNELWIIYQYLCSYEIGYLRYDYDEKNANGNRHPLHHLDINCSNSCTYKIGLSTRMCRDLFIDLLNIETDCHYISLPH